MSARDPPRPRCATVSSTRPRRSSGDGAPARSRAGPLVGGLAAEQGRGRLGSFEPAAAADLILGGVLLQALIDIFGHRSADEVSARLDGMSRTVLTGLRPTVSTHPTTPRGGPDDR